MNNLNSESELDQVLTRVHEELEGGASAERIKQIANENAAARAEILAFAAEWFASEGSDLSDDALGVDRTVAQHAAILEQFWQMSRPAEADPFSGLPADNLQQIANRCRIDMVVLRQLVRGLIDETTIPGTLIAWLAEATSTRISDVWSYLSVEPAFASADFFAPSGKKAGKKLNFANAVRDSNMTLADKQFWLAHLEH